jgi:tetratricopeptide (TPR) repeat protein
MDTDRNLLFGVLALQADLLDNDQFAEACSAWAARREMPLADLLVEWGWLTPQDKAEVQRLLPGGLRLADEPSEASRDSLAWRLVRWGRRHRRLLRSGMSVLLTAVVALALGIGAVERQRKQTEVADARTHQAREQAAANFNLAQEAVDRFLNALPENRRLGEQDRLALRKQLLEAAVPLYERLAQTPADHPEAEAARGRVYFRLALVRNQLGETEAAVAAYERMRAVFERLATDFPQVPEYRQELARSDANRGVLLDGLGRRPEAEAAYRRALALYEQLAADFPAVPTYALELGASYSNLGRLLRDRGDPAASLAWFEKARAALEPVLEKEPRLVTTRLYLRNVHGGRAQALNRLGRDAEAASEWEQTLALNDEKPRAGWFRLQLSLSLSRAGQHARATATAQELLRAGNVENGTLYNAACVYARAARGAPPQTGSPHDEQYADRAVELLRQAVQQGWKDVAHIKQDSDLDGLRQRPDFQQLLADLEAKAAGK